MARKKPVEEHENLERWLVSYADFITLLFAFFVVMYSISSVNEGKYRVLSNSMSNAFSVGKPATSIAPIRIGDPIKSPVKQIVKNPSNKYFIDIKSMTSSTALDEQMRRQAEGQKQALGKMVGDIKKGLKGLLAKDLITIRGGKNSIEIEIKTSILFASGESRLQRAVLPALKKLAGILKDTSYYIQVEGFTDNVPINTETFPSNWELSAARAASVVHLFTVLKIDPSRMSAVGYGEYRPIADNANEKGRSKNRRVVIVVLPNEKVRRMRENVNVSQTDNKQ